jgi:hypothetical protein
MNRQTPDVQKARAESYVSRVTYRRLNQILIAEAKGEPPTAQTAPVARGAVRELTPGALEQIVSDSLEGRGNVGTL